ncbi:arrestin domain-containing protein 3-like isoform X1 [Amblyraja radiata]|uniref:arrestin domain-containing protein 3-like isoform X1 n=1 Tax=Amblyraja radiata TaxID=386614 RepID=UPI0014037F59|nr:arrestin domain-containing protein 3-like isoform X1 [Amblyraja radiata]
MFSLAPALRVLSSVRYWAQGEVPGLSFSVHCGHSHGQGEGCIDRLRPPYLLLRGMGLRSHCSGAHGSHRGESAENPRQRRGVCALDRKTRHWEIPAHSGVHSAAEILQAQVPGDWHGPPLPSSFKGTYGHVSYWMTAKLHRPLKLRIKTKEPFTVYNQVDINTPRLLEPHTAANEKTICCWCCASGPISLKAEVERMGYVAGESIKIFVEIENHSSRKVVPKAAIVKTIIFHAKTKKKTLSEVIIKTKGEPVLAGQKDSRNSMMLEIPELIPTLMNCSIIQMDYSIQVTVDIPRSMGLTVDLPIVIGTIPLHSYGGPASDFNNQYGMNYSNVNHGFPEGSAVEAGFQAANKSLGYYT